ncbi:MAG: hypothetical protein IRZ16_09685 [Myxococcaceae bacterium]|nr:hypothetical protein [Myxococcaceae bacterium]
MKAPLVLAFAAIATLPVHAAEAPARPEPITVSVDLRALSPQTSERIDALTLESRVVLRLIEEGFAVAASWSEPDVRVRLEEADGAVTLTAVGGGEEERGKVTLGAGTARELQLEIAQKIVDLCRGRVEAVEHARQKARAPGPLRKPPPPPEIEVPAPPPEPLFVDLSVGAGALWRGYGVDPQVSASIALMTRQKAGMALLLAYDRPISPDLDLHEFQIAAGPKVGLLRSKWIDVDVGLAAGVVAHAFEYKRPATGTKSGTVLDFVGLVPMSVRWKLGRWFRIGLDLTPGYGARVIHQLDGQPLFQRGDARLETSLAAAVAF